MRIGRLEKGIAIHSMDREGIPGWAVQRSPPCMTMPNGFWLILTLLVLMPAALFAELPSGLPPIHEIAPEAGNEPRFHSVAQSPDGMVHIGGSRAVHSFDDRRWQTMAMPNGHLVRSLLHDGDRRLYVGGYGSFGYARVRPDGLLEYIELTPSPEDIPGDHVLADIWYLMIAPEGVYFVGLHHAFLYNPASEEVRSWYHPGRFGAIVHYRDRTLLQFRDVGLKVFDGRDFRLAPGGETLSSQVYELLPLVDGGLLTLERDGRWLVYDEGRLQSWPMAEKLPDSGAFSASLVLPDGSLALAMPEGRLYLVDVRTERIRHFEVARDYITDLALANDGGLLVQSDSGTLHVSWPSAWTRIGSRTGLRGRMHGLGYWNDEWQVVTNAGVHRTFRDHDDRVRFASTDLTSFEAWDWLTLDDGSAILADSYALYLLNDGEPAKVLHDDLYPRLLKLSRFDERQLLVGTEYGLAVFEYNGASWDKRFVQREFTGRVQSIKELDSGHLLLAIDGHGVVEVFMTPDMDQIASWHPRGDDEGIVYGRAENASLFRSKTGAIVASTKEGFFQWHDGQFEPVEMNGLMDKREPDSLYHLRLAPDGTLWAYSHDRLWRLPRDGSWIREDLTALRPGAISMLEFVDDGVVLVGGIASILRFDPSVRAPDWPAAGVALRTVLLTTADGQQQRLPLDGRDLIMPHDLASMVFEYALPVFRRPELTRYQAHLSGYDIESSGWSEVTRITYSYFTPGDYRFIVRARDSQGRVSESTPFEFRVLPPWYRMAWAWVLWIGLGLLLLALLIHGLLRWRLARLDSDRQRLADMVEQRTSELAAANRKLESMANLDGLTAVANRRRLDRTMSEAWKRSAERGKELSVMLIDVDHFKHYNDNHGHQAGDDILRQVAAVLTSCLRRNEDLVGRYGGEEFMCIMPGAGGELALQVAEIMRERVERECPGITISIGLTSVQPGYEQRITDVIKQADQALYAAKQAGRNRVHQAAG